ncbi:transglycosylase SLT domain-containing protein [Streptomyces sp. NPDC058848]|uniref:transglycosylase SLT domain-containing protein n=1 Tax=Streptomyces sp. NPDC058848 TaxID=3346650 RepID=UPI003682702A
MARAVGWGERSADAAEVAMAESGGDDKIVNSIGCVGLMQINQPVHVKAHPTWTRKWLQNPMNNLKAALVLYEAAGRKFDGPWLDSRDKGGGGGWGGKVSGSSGGTRGTQVDDDPCGLLYGPAKEACMEAHEGGGGGGGVLDGMAETAAQLGRIAQAVAKAGNWLSDPNNWVRIAYVGGGAFLALVAVNTIVQPYAARSYRQVAGALPTKTAKDVARQVRGTRTTETREQ